MYRTLFLVVLAALLPVFLGPATSAQDVGSGRHDLTGPIRLDWIARYDGEMSGVDRVASLALSPNGSTVFITGESYGPEYNLDYLTIAYDSATGEPLWETRYDGPWHHNDSATEVLVSPDGALVFVTGTSTGYSATDWDYQTVAYEATTGVQLWESCYHADGNVSQWDSSLAVAPNGSTLFLTGVAACPGDAREGNVTVAYDALTGDQLWSTCFDAPLTDREFAAQLAVSPDSAKVFVTGTYFVPDVGHDYLTLAYDAKTGAMLWTSRYNGRTVEDEDSFVIPPGELGALRYNSSRGIGMDPMGALVFVVGESKSPNGTSDYATVAYDTASGAAEWVARYDGPKCGQDRAFAVAVSPDGQMVVVTGQSENAAGDSDFVTVAYSALDGNRLWVARYGGPENEGAHGVVISSDSRTVVVAGEAWGESKADWVVVAYDATTGAELWVARYDGPISHADFCRGVAVSPDQDSFFVTGHSCGCGATDYDFTTASYSIAPTNHAGHIPGRPVREGLRQPRRNGHE